MHNDGTGFERELAKAHKMNDFDTIHMRLLGLLIPAARKAEREIADALAPLGLAPSQFAIIDLLDMKGDLRPAEIARALDVETSTITLNLRRADRDGLIVRKPDPSDARSILISSSADAQARVEAARIAIKGVEHRLTDGLTDEEMAALRSGMLRVLKGRRS